MATPPGVSERDFSRALNEFAAVVGSEWVFSSDEDVNLYRDAYSPFWNEQEDRVPSAAVAPDGVEQVQAIVRIANAYKIPLWTIATGRNLGYGGSSPVLSGSVVVDLKRMNRVLEINDKIHYAVVEPGVSYFDLYRYIQERKLNVWIDPADPGWLRGNALGAAADAPMRDHWGGISRGGVRRRGAAPAWVRALEVWHQYRISFGPMDGYSPIRFIVTLGLRLIPAPGYRGAGGAGGIRPVRRRTHTCELRYPARHDASAPVLSYHVSQGGVVREMPGGLRGGLDRMAAKKSSYWSAEFRFWGPGKLVDAQWEYVKEKFGEIPDATFSDGRFYEFPAEVDETDPTLTVALGRPSLAVFGLLQGGGHLGFSPIIPMTGEAIFKAQRVFGELYAELGLPVGNQFAALPWSYYRRALVLLFGLPMSHDVESNRQSREIFERLVQVSAENGWGEYRTHVAFMDSVADAYSYNNHALRRFHETLKDAIDPNGILSPGKSGIWPRRLRGA
jgi:4-cresol dehydrogenase (hydroxylating)